MSACVIPATAGIDSTRARHKGVFCSLAVGGEDVCDSDQGLRTSTHWARFAGQSLPVCALRAARRDSLPAHASSFGGPDSYALSCAATLMACAPE